MLCHVIAVTTLLAWLAPDIFISIFTFVWF